MINKKKIAVIGLSGLIAITGAITAFAANSNSGSTKIVNIGHHAAKFNPSQIAGTIKSTLDGLVTAGTITQAQEDAIQKDMPSEDGRGGHEGKGMNPVSTLVTAGTITQVQADAIESAMKTGRDSQKSMKDILDGLVTAGTITQAQEDAIQKDMPPKDGRGGPQRKGFNPISSLVTAGTITQAQADAIESAMKTGRDSQKSMKDILDSLVTAGTITQAQEDAIQKDMPSKDGRGGPQGKSMNPMSTLVTAGTITQVQADAIESAMKTGRDSQKSMKDILDSLVTAGTITQAQEDAIQKDMPPIDGRGGPEGKGMNPFSTLVTAGTITQVQADAVESAMKAALSSLNKAN